MHPAAAEVRPGGPVIEAAAVSKRYGHRDALSDVHVAVPPGQVHGLLGPNGAGKTTLIRIILGLVTRDAGTVRLLGRPMAPTGGTLPDGAAGYADTPAFYPYLSGRRNLMLLARLDHDQHGGRTARVERALDEVGLGARAHSPVSAYSAGMRQRLGLAAALLRSPRVLLLDEPTRALDPAGARDVRALVGQLAGTGTAILLSSHDLVEVEQLCTEVTVLREGRVVYAGRTEVLRAVAPPDAVRLQTSNDLAAVQLARQWPGLTAVEAADRPGLEVSATPSDLDGYVIALGKADIAVRMLERRPPSIASLFLRLTAGDHLACDGDVNRGAGVSRP